MVSKRTIEWRERYSEKIKQWKKEMEELRARSYEENWTQDRYQMEIMQKIENQKMRDVFIFAKNYIARYKRGKFRELMAKAYQEMVDYGVIEPSRLTYLERSINTARRKM